MYFLVGYRGVCGNNVRSTGQYVFGCCICLCSVLDMLYAGFAYIDVCLGFVVYVFVHYRVSLHISIILSDG